MPVLTVQQRFVREQYRNFYRDFRTAEPNTWHRLDDLRQKSARSQLDELQLKAWNAAADSYVDHRRYSKPGYAHMPALIANQPLTDRPRLIAMITPMVKFVAKDYCIEVSWVGAYSLVAVYKDGFQSAYCTSQTHRGLFERLALGKRAAANLRPVRPIQAL